MLQSSIEFCSCSRPIEVCGQINTKELEVVESRAAAGKGWILYEADARSGIERFKSTRGPVDVYQVMWC